MNHFELEIPQLRSALVQFGAIMLFSTVLVGSSYLYRNTHLDARDQANRQLHGLIDGYRSAVTSERIIRTRFADFQTLRAHGFVDGEPRLQWIENIRDLARRAQFPKIRYQLEERQQYNPDEALNMGSYQLYASPMQLSFDLYHAGDLLTFLQALDARSGGLYDLPYCNLQRLDKERGVSLTEPNIRGRCDLVWFTLHSLTKSDEDYAG